MFKPPFDIGDRVRSHTSGSVGIVVGYTLSHAKVRLDKDIRGRDLETQYIIDFPFNSISLLDDTGQLDLQIDAAKFWAWTYLNREDEDIFVHPIIYFERVAECFGNKKVSRIPSIPLLYQAFCEIEGEYDADRYDNLLSVLDTTQPFEHNHQGIINVGNRFIQHFKERISFLHVT
jgi:hypothetical protein